jgi:hypothetical protein
MIQLDTADTRSATFLPSLDSGSSEPSSLPNADTGARASGWVADDDTMQLVPYVSPPPMPWPRVFPSL